MANVKLITHLLLVAAMLSMAYHRSAATAHVPASNMAVFLATQGKSYSHQFEAPVAEEEIPAALVYTVTATAYQPEVSQTDAEPFVTADNSTIKSHYSSKTHWMALSRDLLARWGGDFQYGDRVLVRGISPQLDGVYTIHDTMNRRHRHCMDILTHASEKIDILTKNVKLQLVAATTSADSSRSVSRARAVSLARLQRAATSREADSSKPLLARNKQVDYFASVIL